AGITVADEIIARYEGLDRAQAEALAVELSADFARDIAPAVDGFYLVTPFGRTGLIARILDRFREEGLI
ncbi:MAG: bifunctional homocysteine S-methyltransferase/methylenetetrahydrofolate reductase, partial [Candidatus Limivicinus sp.]